MLTSSEHVMREECTDLAAELQELHGEPRPPNLLACHPATLALYRLVNSPKGDLLAPVGGRARRAGRADRHLRALWPPSYLAASCGGASPSRSRKEYLRGQQRPG